MSTSTHNLPAYPRTIEPCSPSAGRTIFDGSGNHFTGIDPANIRLLSDRVLIRDLPQDDSRIGSIWLPDEARNGGVGKGGLFRVGVVVAVGPGDRFIEGQLDAEGRPTLKLITKPCEVCDGDGVAFWDDPADDGEPAPCGTCDGSGRVPVVVSPQCKPGDIVISDRRRDMEVYFDGVLHTLCHAEQSVIAVLEAEQ